MNEFLTPSAPAPTAAPTEVPPAFRLLRALAGLLQVPAVVMLVVPWLVTMAARRLGYEGAMPDGPVRIAGVVLLVLTSIARVAIPGGRRRYPADGAFAELAASTGGTYSIEPRQLGTSGWSGGPTVRWTLQGVPASLERYSQSQSATTRFAARFTASRDLRFTVLPRNVLTRVVTSGKFVAMIQASVPKSENLSSDEERARAVKEIGFLGGAEVKLGDALLDDKIIVKGNDGDLARYVLAGSGVPERMGELNARRGAWTLSLSSADGGDAVQLHLDLTGTETRPAALQAAKDLFEAVLASLRRNDVLDAEADPRDAEGRRASR